MNRVAEYQSQSLKEATNLVELAVRFVLRHPEWPDAHQAVQEAANILLDQLWLRFGPFEVGTQEANRFFRERRRHRKHWGQYEPAFIMAVGVARLFFLFTRIQSYFQEGRDITPEMRIGFEVEVWHACYLMNLFSLRTIPSDQSNDLSA